MACGCFYLVDAEKGEVAKLADFAIFCAIDHKGSIACSSKLGAMGVIARK